MSGVRGADAPVPARTQRSPGSPRSSTAEGAASSGRSPRSGPVAAAAPLMPAFEVTRAAAAFGPSLVRPRHPDAGAANATPGSPVKDDRDSGRHQKP